MGGEQSIVQENESLEYKNLFNILNIIPDTPDYRDICYKLGKDEENIELKEEVDLRNKICKNNYLSKSFGKSIAINLFTLITFDLQRKGEEMMIPSIEFIFLNSLKEEFHRESVEEIRFQDCKISIRSSLKALGSFGICEEKHFNSTMNNRMPSKVCYDYGKNFNFKYVRIGKDEEMIKKLLSEDRLILINLSLYTSFLKDVVKSEGKIIFPDEFDTILGMTSCIIVGYDKNKLILRFPFGENWGKDGYGFIDYEYLEKLCNDLWIIEIFVDKRNKYGLNYNNRRNDFKQVERMTMRLDTRNEIENKNNLKEQMFRNSAF